MYVIIVCALSHPSARLLLHGALSFYYRITDVTMRSRLRVWKTFELQVLSVCATFQTQHRRQEEVSGDDPTCCLWTVSQTSPGVSSWRRDGRRHRPTRSPLSTQTDTALPGSCYRKTLTPSESRCHHRSVHLWIEVPWGICCEQRGTNSQFEPGSHDVRLYF